MKCTKVIDYVIHFKRANIEKPKNIVNFKAPRVDDQDNIIFEFCYPEAVVGKQKERLENFSFVLTGIDGMRKYCYCRRKIHTNDSECICIVSQNASFAFYEQILNLFEKYLPKVDAVEQLASALLEQSFPFPGEQIHNSDPAKRLINYSIVRPINDTFTNTKLVSTATLINKFGASEVIDILSHMMLERKFLFVSDYLMTLSNTISSFITLMSPFVWQHVLIPLLPKSLVTYCAAPMPFVIGCLRTLYPEIQNECGDISDVFIIDIDNGNYINKPSFPMLLVSDTSIGLRNILSNIVSKEPKPEDDTVVRAQVLKFFQRLFLNYQKCFKEVKPTEEDKNNPRFKPIQFKWSKFIKKLDPDNEAFITEFQQSQMLDMFIEERENMLINNQSLLTKCPLLVNSITAIPEATTCHWKVLTDYFPTPTSEQKICFFCKQSILTNMPCSLWEGKPIHSKCYRCQSCFKVIVGDRESIDHRCIYCVSKNLPIQIHTEKDYLNHFNNKLVKTAFAMKRWKREIKQTVSIGNYIKKSDDFSSSENLDEMEISEPIDFHSVKVDIKFDLSKPAPPLPSKKESTQIRSRSSSDNGIISQKSLSHSTPNVSKPTVPPKPLTMSTEKIKSNKERPTLPKKSIKQIAIEPIEVPFNSSHSKEDKKKPELPKKTTTLNGNTLSKVNTLQSSNGNSSLSKKSPNEKTKSRQNGGGVARLAGMYENMN
ncbi:DENN domain-containing protein 2D, putative [Entamoeba dispar SAW760]|uniref:DENN domain-containing protein 2D, putative n=1 Tax=Entamoeba dispar (strain ATCC PRA-260 / SAW760) TaxID=370354 RepID=B0EDN4_ENTDS|nr:DENN domain-containing protein 2D, putative [Entamoeba dispar SAW760]EDR27354.1 DENN domain-containing protein 2D, putative [Entamoeba dispar SAW760]|eukprot:EDR27354.1 DENN domain-containing protein 2D, putative [Entamoeba dispar SAW760]